MATSIILKGLGYVVASVITYKTLKQNPPWSVSDKEITKDSSGAIILEGTHGTEPARRKAAVKRGVNSYAFSEEYKIYVEADGLRNVVRCYGMESDWSYVYLFLEPCICSLDDLIRIYSPNYSLQINYSTSTEKERLRKSVKNIVGDDRVTLWKENGYPSPLLLKLMRDVVRGLAQLHENKIAYRNLKAQNILIADKAPLCAKVSNMVTSKKFRVETSSSNYGKPNLEQLYFEREAAKDLYDLGCVLSFCISANKGRTTPESKDLVSQLVYSSSNFRPKAIDVYHHPLFWNSDTKLSFLRDTSDMVEGNRGTNFSKALEVVQPQVMGARWNTKIDSAIIEDGRRYRQYDYKNCLDLLRFIRNVLNHYHELSKEIEELLGPIPEGYYDYFEKRFPNLLIEVYKVVCAYHKEEERFQKYFNGNLE